MATDPMWCYERYEDAAAYIDMLEKQRDELLRVIEGVLSSPLTRIGFTEYMAAKNTIASVKEKQND